MVDLFTQVLSLIEANYPEMLRKCYVINGMFSLSCFSMNRLILNINLILFICRLINRLFPHIIHSIDRFLEGGYTSVTLIFVNQ